MMYKHLLHVRCIANCHSGIYSLDFDVLINYNWYNQIKLIIRSDL